MHFGQCGTPSHAVLAITSLCLALSLPARAQYQWTCRTSGPNGGNTGPPFEGHCQLKVIVDGDWDCGDEIAGSYNRTGQARADVPVT